MAQTTHWITGDYNRKSVNHSVEEWVGRDRQTTNSIQGFFSQLQCTIKRTHFNASRNHLAKYPKECEFRYYHRHAPASMLPALLSQFPSQDV